MNINEIIQIADKAYGDGLISQYWDPEKGHPVDNDCSGDTLAIFIVRELFETYDETESTEQQLKEAMRCIASAASQLDDVQDGLLAAMFTNRKTDAN